MKTKFINQSVLFLGVIIVLSCSKGSETIIPEGVEVINGFLYEKDSSATSFNYSDYLDSVTYFVLETNKESVMGGISGCHLVKDTMYISDYQSIYIYDIKGNYVRKISKRGRGRGEYLQLSFFDVNKRNGEIYIYDSGKNQIMIYSPKGDFLRSFPVPVVRDFAVTESGNFVFCYPDYTDVGIRGVWLTDKNGTFIKQLVTESDKYRSVVLRDKYFVHVNDSIISYMGGEDNDYIYHISEDTAKVVYKIQSDIKISKRNLKKQLPQFDQISSYYKDELVETERLLSFVVTNGQGRQVKVFYDKKLKKEYQLISDIVTEEFSDPLGGDKYPVMMPPYGCENGVIIAGIDAGFILDQMEDAKKILNLSRELTPESNMIMNLVYTSR